MLVVLISGSGSNLQAIIDSGTKVDLVVSNRENAGGLERARTHKIPTVTLVARKGQDRLTYDTQLWDTIMMTQGFQVKQIVCAGWMRILSGWFIEKCKDCNISLINLHPAMPGTYPGTNAIQRIWQDYEMGLVKESDQGAGVMVHHVVEEIDAGDVIVCERVPLKDHPSLSSFEENVHSVEHRLIVKAISMILNNTKKL